MRIHEFITETFLPTSAFAGSDKNKLGPAGHLKGSMKRPAGQGDLVGEQNAAEGKEDKIAQLKKDHATAVHWSKNETSPQKREAARQKAEKIKRHLDTQYKQGVAEGSVKELQLDLRVLSDEQFQQMYKMTKADARKQLSNVSEDQSVAEKTDADLCRSSKRLGSSDHSSCVSQGLRAHQSKGKGHTDGQGSYIKGKKIRGSKYGGPLPDQDGK